MPRRRDQELLRLVGQRVALIRKDRGWTQEQLAEAIEIEPVSLSRLETGHRALSLTTLHTIAKALGTGLGDLLDTERDVPEPEHAPDESELLRLYGQLPPQKQDIILRLARDLSGT
jgi:transcriptional regulator with XRE-family HTH domain